jgi:hypothetical protein
LIAEVYDYLEKQRQAGFVTRSKIQKAKNHYDETGQRGRLDLLRYETMKVISGGRIPFDQQLLKESPFDEPEKEEIRQLAHHGLNVTFAYLPRVPGGLRGFLKKFSATLWTESTISTCQLSSRLSGNPLLKVTMSLIRPKQLILNLSAPETKDLIEPVRKIGGKMHVFNLQNWLLTLL